jgi:hypothetical protein
MAVGVIGVLWRTRVPLPDLVEGDATAGPRGGRTEC